MDLGVFRLRMAQRFVSVERSFNLEIAQRFNAGLLSAKAIDELGVYHQRLRGAALSIWQR